MPVGRGREVRRCYYEHAGLDDVVGIEPTDLYGAALAHYRYGQERAPDRPGCTPRGCPTTAGARPTPRSSAGEVRPIDDGC